MDLPPMEENIRNLEDMPLLEIEQYQVAEWHPLPEGRGKPTQVHFILTLRQIPAQFHLRLKSARACDELIAVLQRHRDNVWGKAPHRRGDR